MKPTKLDRALAKVCATCPVCRTARRKQRGAAYRLVKNVEGHICPFCQAYARVHGRKAHEPQPVILSRTAAQAPTTNQPKGDPHHE